MSSKYINYTMVTDGVKKHFQAGPFWPFSIGRELRDIKHDGGTDIHIVPVEDETRLKQVKTTYQSWAPQGCEY